MLTDDSTFTSFDNGNLEHAQIVTTWSFNE